VRVGIYELRHPVLRAARAVEMTVERWRRVATVKSSALRAMLEDGRGIGAVAMLETAGLDAVQNTGLLSFRQP